MATLPFPSMLSTPENRGSTIPEDPGSLLFGNAPPALDGSGAGPPAPTFTQLMQEMAERKQPVSLPRLSEALIGDVLNRLDNRGAFADAYQAVEVIRQVQESPYEFFRELVRIVFTSLGTLPGASDDIPVPTLVARMRQLLPRLDLRAVASPTEKDYALVQMDLMEYVTNPTMPTTETSLGTTAVDLSGSPEGSLATTFHGFDIQGRAVPHVATPEGAQVRMPAIHPTQMQVEEPVSTYARLAELQAVLADDQRRLQGKRGQDLQATAASTLVSLVTKAMSDAATADVMPRASVISFRLGYQVAMQPLQGIVDRLMLGVVAHFAAGQKAEELAYALLRPVHIEVLGRIWQAAQRVKGEESQIFAIRIRPALQGEILRSALRADDNRVVTLDPRQLQATLTSWTCTNPLVKRAVFSNEQGYQRWLTVAERMQQVEARRPGSFKALSLSAPLQGERAGVLEFAPVSLARCLSDPSSARALLLALRTPAQLAQSQIAMRLRAESYAEMQGQESAA